MYQWKLLRHIPYLKAAQHLIPNWYLSYITQFGWNKEILGYGDFASACDRNDILIVTGSGGLPGAYNVVNDRPVIYLRNDLIEPFKSFVSIHEISHSSLDSGVPCFYADLPDTRIIECRVNMIAACSLIPLRLMEHLTQQDMLHMFNYPADLYGFRRAIYKQCGF
jgi:hypothetical protein